MDIPENNGDKIVDYAMTADLSFVVSIMMAENSAFEGRLLRYILSSLLAILALFFSIIFESMIVWVVSFLLILGVIIWSFVEMVKVSNRRMEMDALRSEARAYFVRRIRQFETKNVGVEDVKSIESRRRALESLRVFLRIAESSEFSNL